MLKKVAKKQGNGIRNFAIKLPAIISDIDGVLIRGGKPIIRSKEAIYKIKSSLADLNANKFNGNTTKLPFLWLTNGGGTLEERKAEAVNKILGIDKLSMKINKNEMVLCTTPFKSFVDEYKDKYILIAGWGETIEAANNYGFKKAIHQHEYSTLFPNLCPFNSRYRSESTKKEIFANLKKRFGDSFDIPKIMSGEQKIPISAWFTYHDVVESEEAVQLFTDLCISKDGIPGSVLDPHEKQFVKWYIYIKCWSCMG